MADRDESFDFALVDGYRRDVAVSTAIRKVRPGGFVYLDNSDVPDAEHSSARSILLGAAKSAPEILPTLPHAFPRLRRVFL